jgi:hypothetical protein
MQIEIRQRYCIEATLENTTALAIFLILSNGRHKVRFTHPREIKTSMAGSRIISKAAVPAPTEPFQPNTPSPPSLGTIFYHPKPSYHQHWRCHRCNWKQMIA